MFSKFALCIPVAFLAMGEAQARPEELAARILQNVRPMKTLQFRSTVETRMPDGTWKKTRIERHLVDYENMCRREDSVTIVDDTQAFIASEIRTPNKNTNFSYLYTNWQNFDFDSTVPPASASGAVSLGNWWVLNPFLHIYEPGSRRRHASLFSQIKGELSSAVEHAVRSGIVEDIRISLGAEVIDFSANTGAFLRRGSARTTQFGEEFTLHRIEVLKSANIVGWNMPVAVEQTWRDSKTLEVESITRHTIQPETIAIDTDIPRSMFQIAFPIGSIVTDNVLGKTYHVTNPGGLSDTEENVVRKLDSMIEGLKE